MIALGQLIKDCRDTELRFQETIAFWYILILGGVSLNEEFLDVMNADIMRAQKDYHTAYKTAVEGVRSILLSLCSKEQREEFLCEVTELCKKYNVSLLVSGYYIKR